MISQSNFSNNLDSGNYNKWVLDTLAQHYSALVFKYVPAKSLGQEKVELTPDILAHLIIVHACACVLSVKQTKDSAYAGYAPGFGDSLSSGDDYVMVLDSENFPDYPMTAAKKILEEDIKSGYTSEEKLRADIEKIVPKDQKLIMIWDVSLQNMAKSRGEFKKMLEAAMESQDLTSMPKVIAEVNRAHTAYLLKFYGHGAKCQSCGWDLCFNGSITIINNFGNEEDFIYYQCDNDFKYFRRRIEEDFNTDEVKDNICEFDSEKAKSDLEAIKKCPKPDDKHCKCEVHRNYKF